MNTIKIKVYVPEIEAAKLGKLAYGETEWSPKESDWAQIPIDVRVFLTSGRFGSRCQGRGGQSTHLYLDAGEVTLATVKSTAERDMAAQHEDAIAYEAECKAAAEREAAALETQVQKLLNLTDPITSNYGPEHGQNPFRFVWQEYGYAKAAEDPRIQALEAKLQPKLDEKNARAIAWQEEQDRKAEDARKERRAEIARQDARKAEAERKHEELEAATREEYVTWAKTQGGALGRAAEEEYDIVGGVVEAVATSLHERLKTRNSDLPMNIMHENPNVSMTTRKSPNAAAFAVFDRTKDEFDKLPSSFQPKRMKVQLLKVQLITENKSKSYTAIVVKISSAIHPPCFIIMKTEPEKPEKK